MAKEEDKSNYDTNITCFPSIAVLNANVGASPPFPVKLDGNLSHIKFIVGRKNTKGAPITSLWSLIDSGVGGTIGFLNYIEGVVMLNPYALVIIFTSCGGEYSSIFTRVIVFNDTGGVTTTEFTVDFQIRTPYRCFDGSELHLIVSLGAYVSFKFIFSNVWMKQIVAVLDYGAKQLRGPLQDDLCNFRLAYRVPQKNFPSPDLRGSHEISIMALPKIEVFLSVMTAFNPNSPWLGSDRDMVCILQASSATGLPPITALSKLASSFPCKEDMDTPLDGRFMPPTNPDVLNIPVHGDASASNTSHLIFEIFG